MTRVSGQTVAWIGLGAMGAPMAARVAAIGCEIVGYDVRAGRAGELGFSSAATAGEAFAQASIAVIMVATPAQAESVLFEAGGALDSLASGATVIVTATVGPHAIAAWAPRLAQAGIRLVDAPVSGGTARAATGELLVFASGDDSALAAARPILHAFAAQVVVVGANPGDGQKMKLVNQLLCGVHIAAAAEALAFAEALGLDAGRCLEAIRGGAAASFMLDDRGRRMVEGTFEPVKSALDLFVKDLGLVTDTARTLSLPTPIAAAAERLYRAGHDAGLGRFDDSITIEVARSAGPAAPTAHDEELQS